MRTSWFDVLRNVAAGLLLCGLACAAAAENAVRVKLDVAHGRVATGRLLVFAAPAAQADVKDGKVQAVDINLFNPTQVYVAAMDVPFLAPGGEVKVDTDALAYPGAFSSLPAGEYYVQAVLDVGRDYNYTLLSNASSAGGGRGAGDVLSEVVNVRWPAAQPRLLTLSEVVPERDVWDLPKQLKERDVKRARAHMRALDFSSAALAKFSGVATRIRGWVLLPPGYDKSTATYPTVYYIPGFGGSLNYLAAHAVKIHTAMAEGHMPPMIWVFLDHSIPAGAHEFADSVNNGPWGTALIEELVPSLEQQYRMDAAPSGRFLTGHSSGGWATLWLQVTYPETFGGGWASAPDASDFHDFSGINLYEPAANVFRKADGTPWPLIRLHGRVLFTFELYARMERVLGEYGGQLASFEWVFSPRGADGRPLPMFNRYTGAVDARVMTYWREHYDIVYKLKTQWPALKPHLDGKIHLIVGEADNIHLEGAARRLKAALEELGANADVRIVPERDHFNLHTVDNDDLGLLKQIAGEMYRVARPQAGLPKQTAH
jgi:hypothetical protein